MKDVQTNSSSVDLRGLSPRKTEGTLSTTRKYEDASKIHALYQELFVSDLKRDLEAVESQAQIHKEKYVEA